MMALLSRLENDPPENPALLLLHEAIAEWMDREFAWQNEYPYIPPPEWTRRELTPAAEKRLNRKIRRRFATK